MRRSLDSLADLIRVEPEQDKHGSKSRWFSRRASTPARPVLIHRTSVPAPHSAHIEHTEDGQGGEPMRRSGSDGWSDYSIISAPTTPLGRVGETGGELVDPQIAQELSTAPSSASTLGGAAGGEGDARGTSVTQGRKYKFRLRRRSPPVPLPAPVLSDTQEDALQDASEAAALDPASAVIDHAIACLPPPSLTSPKLPSPKLPPTPTSPPGSPNLAPRTSPHVRPAPLPPTDPSLSAQLKDLKSKLIDAQARGDRYAKANATLQIERDGLKQRVAALRVANSDLRRDLAEARQKARDRAVRDVVVSRAIERERAVQLTRAASGVSLGATPSTSSTSVPSLRAGGDAGHSSPSTPGSADPVALFLAGETDGSSLERTPSGSWSSNSTRTAGRGRAGSGSGSGSASVASSRPSSGNYTRTYGSALTMSSLEGYAYGSGYASVAMSRTGTNSSIGTATESAPGSPPRSLPRSASDPGSVSSVSSSSGTIVPLILSSGPSSTISTTAIVDGEEEDEPTPTMESSRTVPSPACQVKLTNTARVVSAAGMVMLDAGDKDFTFSDLSTMAGSPRQSPSVSPPRTASPSGRARGGSQLSLKLRDTSSPPKTATTPTSPTRPRPSSPSYVNPSIPVRSDRGKSPSPARSRPPLRRSGADSPPPTRPPLPGLAKVEGGADDGPVTPLPPSPLEMTRELDEEIGEVVEARRLSFAFGLLRRERK